MGTQKSGIRVGWSRREITPTGPCEVVGQYYRRVATGVRDRLYVTACALEAGRGGGGSRQAVMVSMDTLWVTASMLKEVRRRVRRRVRDLDVRRIILNAIHTHSAPPVDYQLSWAEPIAGLTGQDGYTEWVIERMTEAIEEAWRKRSPGYVSRVLGQARVGHCRRAWYANGTAEMYGETDRPDFIGMESSEDSGVDMVFCWDARKKLTGVWINLACPSQGMEARYVVSADFMGEARQQLQERFGRHLFVLPQISAAGDQSPRDLVRHYRDGEPDMWYESGIVELGRRIAAAVVEGCNKARASMEQRVVLAHVVKNVKLPIWRVTRAEYLRAQKIVRKLRGGDPAAVALAKAFKRFVTETKAQEAKGGPGPYDSKLHDFVILLNSEAVLKRFASQRKQSDVSVELHAIRLGEAALVSNPFELFLDYGSRMKARSRAQQTLVVQLACGYEGYLPTEKAVARGGYGATMASVAVGPEGGQRLVEESLKAMNALWRR